VYGLMVHTRFFADRPRAEAEYEAMKRALHVIVSQLSAADPPGRGTWPAPSWIGSRHSPAATAHARVMLRNVCGMTTGTDHLGTPL